MKTLFLAVHLVFIGVTGVFAQSPFDSNVYVPEMGNPDELDTIYGGQAYQHLGNGLHGLPPLKGQPYGRLLFEGLPTNPPFLTAVETGPTFNLHKLKVEKKFPYNAGGFGNWSNYKLGNFRSPRYTDMIIMGSGHPVIYWADENGEYDSSRYTMLLPYQYQQYGISTDEMLPYIGKFTSDSVDDIVLNMHFVHIPSLNDSTYMALIKGGQQLFDQGKIAMWDDSVYWGHFKGGPEKPGIRRYSIQGDWRGIGREDLVTVDDWVNYFFYKNDLPFDLQRFAQSLREDTLMTAREWSLYKGHFSGHGGGYTMKAFPKPNWDKSVDMLVPLPIDVSNDWENHNGICIFKGGPDFGSKRLYLDSSDFFLHCPGYYSGDFSKNRWAESIEIAEVGDLTGTGNPVLSTIGAAGIGYSFRAFYVLGKAMDDKIDVFTALHYGGGWSDTISATPKSIPTFIFSSPYYELPEDQNKGIFEKGSVRIYNGSEKIPVRLNPKFAVAPQREGVAYVEVYPNPTARSLNITAAFDRSGAVKITLRDILGRAVYSTERFASAGAETFHIELPRLLPGSYILQIENKTNRFFSKISIIE